MQLALLKQSQKEKAGEELPNFNLMSNLLKMAKNQGKTHRKRLRTLHLTKVHNKIPVHLRKIVQRAKMIRSLVLPSTFEEVE